MSNPALEWSPEEVAAMTTWWMAGLTAARISRKLWDVFHTDRSRNAVIGKAMRLKLPRHNPVRHGRPHRRGVRAA